MAYRIFPTNADVGTTPTLGGVASEANFAGALTGLMGHRKAYIVTGMTIAAATGLNIEIAVGTAMVNGYRFDTTTIIPHTAGASLTDYSLWLRLDRTGGEVDGFTILETASAAPIDDDHLFLGTFTTNGTVVTATLSSPEGGPSHSTGTYTGDNGTARDIRLGFAPVLIFVSVRTVTTSQTRMGISPIRPRAVTPSTVEANIGMTFDETSNAGSLTQDLRPEATTGGFRVGGAGTDSMNEGSFTYDWIAFA